MRPARYRALQPLFLTALLGGSLTAEPPLPHARVNQAIDRGLDYLIQSQMPDGSFHIHTGFPVGSTALGLYTLLKCGLKADHQAVGRAEAYMLSRPEPRTYSQGCVLLALATLDPVRHRARIHALAQELLEWQRPEGLWAYPEGAADFSNTQYALLGLWAAARADFLPPPKSLLKAADTIAKHQGDYGGLTYRPFDQSRAVTGSMSAAGTGSLGLVLELFEKWGVRGSTPAQRAQIKGSLARGLKWFEEHFDPERDPRPSEEPGAAGTWFYYYLYGVERLGAFAGMERFGDRDWYREGALSLLRLQEKRGHWGRYPGNLRDTCFALLFLRRATAPVTEYQPGGPVGLEGGKGEFTIKAGSGHPVAMWVAEWPARLRDYYAWGDYELRIAWLRWFTDKGELGRIEGDEKKPLLGRSALFPLEHVFSENGRFHLQAEAEIVDEGGRRHRVLSDQVLVQVDCLLTPELEAWMGDVALNLLAPGASQAKWSIKASSLWGGNSPDQATDQQAGTAWISAPEDERPWLEIELERPLRATHMLLSPALWHPFEPDAYDLPKSVIVRVGKLRQVVSMPARPAKTVVAFGSRQALTRIYLIVDERHQGKRYKGMVGFSEIELQDRR